MPDVGMQGDLDSNSPCLHGAQSPVIYTVVRVTTPESPAIPDQHDHSTSVENQVPTFNRGLALNSKNYKCPGTQKADRKVPRPQSPASPVDGTQPERHEVHAKSLAPKSSSPTLGALSPQIPDLTSKAARSDWCCRSASCSLTSRSCTVFLKLSASSLM